MEVVTGVGHHVAFLPIVVWREVEQMGAEVVKSLEFVEVMQWKVRVRVYHPHHQHQHPSRYDAPLMHPYAQLCLPNQCHNQLHTP